jgi:membrane fusion protein (multidrug efflux system)
MFSHRFAFAAVMLTAGGLILTGGCKEEVAQKAAAAPVVVVEPAVEMEFSDTVTEVGEIRAFDTVDLSANVSGFLTEANFKEGELVKKGTKLFQIDPAVYEAAVNKAEADLNKAKAKLTNSTMEFERQKRLLSSNATAQSKYDAAEMNLRTAQAELKSAEAELAEKKVDLKYTKILAPFDGYIGFKKFSVGNMVGPSSGALARITRAGDVKVYFSLDELTLLKIFENYPDSQDDVTVAPAVKLFLQNGTEYKEKVRISAWNNMVQDGTLQIQAIAEDPKDILVPGMYVKVVVQVSPLQKRVMVKQEAIMREQLGTFVFVVNAQNKLERRKIATGMKNGAYQVVLSGLAAGERVIVEGLQKAVPGDEVKPITAQQTAPAPAQPKKADAAAAPAPEKTNATEK